MGLTAQLNPLSVPQGTEFPGTVQGLLVQIAQYLEIIGLSNFDGVNFGDSQPSADDRDKPWFETDSSGNPLAWKSWDGSAWSPIRVRPTSGATADRPTDAESGEQYFDTDINTMLVFDRSQWRTLSGSPGDLKFVKATTISDALTANPGWVQDTDSEGRVLVAAVSNGTADGYDVSAGADSHTLTTTELPSHSHKLLSGYGVFPGQFQNGTQAAGIAPLTTGLGSGSTTNTDVTGDGTAIDIRQKSLYRWCILKQ